MSRALVLGGGLAVVAMAVAVGWFGLTSQDNPAPFEPASRTIEPSPLCPWREPDTDMLRFFPDANRRVTETRILSGLRLELAKALGRQPNAEDNSLTLHRIYRNTQPLGVVMARRVKGEHGGIEVVLAVSEQGQVRDVRLQRLREPAVASEALQDPAWLVRFNDRTHDRGWNSEDVEGLPPESRASAQAVREGIHSLLILFAASKDTLSTSATKPHH